MSNYALILLCLIALLHPHAACAQDSASTMAEDSPITQNNGAWQNILDFEETKYFAFIGPPTLENADRAIAETKLFEDMVEHFDDLEDEDDEYLFVAEALLDPDDASRPASLRNDVDESNSADNSNQNQNTSTYIDGVRPTFLPGFQIKPRSVEPDKKEGGEAHSLFADILKPKAEEILQDDVKPILGTEPNKEANKENGVPPSDVSDKPVANDKSPKAGTINAPPKHRAVSPDEETLNQLKQAVKDLGLEKHLNLGNGADGHQVLESKKDTSAAAQATNSTTEKSATENTAPDPSGKSVKPAVSTGKPAYVKKKKASKSRYKMRARANAPAAATPAPPPKEDSIFDLF